MTPRDVLFIMLVVLLFWTLIFSLFILNDFDYRTYTKAICRNNACQDFTFTCLNGHIISSNAISGLVYFDEKWIDLREETGVC